LHVDTKLLQQASDHRHLLNLGVVHERQHEMVCGPLAVVPGVFSAARAEQSQAGCVAGELTGAKPLRVDPLGTGEGLQGGGAVGADQGSLRSALYDEAAVDQGGEGLKKALYGGCRTGEATYLGDEVDGRANIERRQVALPSHPVTPQHSCPPASIAHPRP